MFSKRQVVIGTAALVLASASFAQEACPCGSGTRVNTTAALTLLLSNKTVCASVDNETWQEFHSGGTAAGGPLIDYKKGPGDPVDPSASVGTWVVSPAARISRAGTLVTYNYGSGGSYDYQVCDAGGTVNFCSSTRNIVGATLLPGQVACTAAAIRPSAAARR